MLGWSVQIWLILTAASAATQPIAAGVAATPAAAELFQRDWVLMNWALKYYDANRDVLLSPGETEAAAAQFRRIADADGDGRVTPDEYRAARAFILARY